MEMRVLGTMNQAQVAEFMSQLEQLVKSYNTTKTPGKLVADVAVGIQVYEVSKPGAVPAEPARPKEGKKTATPAIPVARGRNKKDEE